MVESLVLGPAGRGDLVLCLPAFLVMHSAYMQHGLVTCHLPGQLAAQLCYLGLCPCQLSLYIKQALSGATPGRGVGARQDALGSLLGASQLGGKPAGAVCSKRPLQLMGPSNVFTAFRAIFLETKAVACCSPGSLPQLVLCRPLPQLGMGGLVAQRQQRCLSSAQELRRQNYKGWS